MTVVVVGEPAADTGEASSRSDIGLPGQQQALVQPIAATGKPYVVVLMNGRPLTLGWLADPERPGLLEAWYPGTEGGDAVADVLFGKVDPGGKLPMSFPRQRRPDPDLLQRAADRPAGGPEQQVHVEVPRRAQQPQYAFGYGLSYTTFSISRPDVSSAADRRSRSARTSPTPARSPATTSCSCTSTRATRASSSRCASSRDSSA